jgi:hypothetical protein
MKAGEDRLRGRRGHERQRAAGTGPDHDLPFTDRVIATLVHLRLQLPHAALAELYRVDRSTVSRAIHQVRPLLAARGFAVPGHPGLRLRTLADVFACAAAEGVELRIDGTEVQVRRPKAGKPGRRAFVSGKKKQNTKKAAVFTGPDGGTLWAGAFRPGRMHDQTAVRVFHVEPGQAGRFPGGRGVVDDISHEGLRVLLRAEGVTFQRLKTWNLTTGQRTALAMISLSRIRGPAADRCCQGGEFEEDLGGASPSMSDTSTAVSRPFGASTRHGRFHLSCRRSPRAPVRGGRGLPRRRFLCRGLACRER